MSRLKQWQQEQRSQGKTIAATNGCFDILHIGHLRILQAARGSADLLVVGLNSDASVRRLKGDSRPINPQTERAELLAAIEAVDLVVIFEHINAAAFLRQLQPDFWWKGSDYTLETLSRDEKSVLTPATAIRFASIVPDRSTSGTLARLSQ